jgi:hypothetical protein
MAYLLAVTTASFVYTIILAGSDIISMISAGGLENSTMYAHHSRLIFFSVMKGVTFIAAWMFVFILPLVPYSLGITIVRNFRITRCLFFVGGGALTAALLCFVYIAIPNLGINFHETGLTSAQKYLTDLPLFLLCGSIAGFVTRRYLIK